MEPNQPDASYQPVETPNNEIQPQVISKSPDQFVGVDPSKKSSRLDKHWIGKLVLVLAVCMGIMAFFLGAVEQSAQTCSAYFCGLGIDLAGYAASAVFLFVFLLIGLKKFVVNSWLISLVATVSSYMFILVAASFITTFLSQVNIVSGIGITGAVLAGIFPCLTIGLLFVIWLLNRYREHPIIAVAAIFGVLFIFWLGAGLLSARYDNHVTESQNLKNLTAVGITPYLPSYNPPAYTLYSVDTSTLLKTKGLEFQYNGPTANADSYDIYETKADARYTDCVNGSSDLDSDGNGSCHQVANVNGVPLYYSDIPPDNYEYPIPPAYSVYYYQLNNTFFIITDNDAANGERPPVLTQSLVTKIVKSLDVVSDKQIIAKDISVI